MAQPMNAVVTAGSKPLSFPDGSCRTNQTTAGTEQKGIQLFLTDLSPIEDDLLDMKEDTLDPVQCFMSGSPRDIYDESKRFLEEQNANFAGLTGDESQQVKDILADAECFKGNKIQQLK